MNRLKALAIAAIATLVFGSLAIGITANAGGNSAGVDTVAAGAASTVTPSEGPPQVIDQTLSFPDDGDDDGWDDEDGWDDDDDEDEDHEDDDGDDERDHEEDD